MNYRGIVSKHNKFQTTPPKDFFLILTLVDADVTIRLLDRRRMRADNVINISHVTEACLHSTVKTDHCVR